MKQKMFAFFSDEVINQPEYYAIKDDEHGETVDLELLASEAQEYFDYHMDIVHTWAHEWLQHIFRLTPDQKP